MITRVALRDWERSPRPNTNVVDDEAKLLADARYQLIVEAGRWRVRRACAVTRRAGRHDPTGGRLARRYVFDTTHDEQRNRPDAFRNWLG